MRFEILLRAQRKNYPTSPASFFLSSIQPIALKSSRKLNDNTIDSTERSLTFPTLIIDDPKD